MSAVEIDLRTVGVVVVTHHPEAGIERRLALMAAQGAVLVVVDNASDEATRSLLRVRCRDHDWDLIANETNVGVATALNQGVRWLAGRGLIWALCFDQDSEPAGDLSIQLLASCGRHAEPERIAVVGPTFHDPETGREHRFLRPHPWCPGLFSKTPITDRDQLVTMVITSGSLVRLAAFAAVGAFDDGLFIDFVDTDFCLRCREAQWRVLASSGARMAHRLGHRERRRCLGFAVDATNHAPVRHYYIARNRIALLRRHALAEPHWCCFECAASMLWAFRVLTVEQGKAAKIRAMLLGTWDGLRGHEGPIPRKRMESLHK